MTSTKTSGGAKKRGNGFPRRERPAAGPISSPSGQPGLGACAATTSTEALESHSAGGEAACCQSLPTQRTGSDCFSACLSWLLRLPQDEVPDFTDQKDPNSGKFYHNVAEFLNARGLRMMMIEWRDMPAYLGGPVIARGTSPREKAHAVLWDDDGLMHDPHPSRAGLVGDPTHAMLIVSHNSTTSERHCKP